MSQARQSQPVFADIHMNNGHRIGVRKFSDILKGRFHGDMQLAFEQYLGDFRVYGATHGTYRYEIVKGDMLIFHALLNPLTTGAALATPVTQPGSQYPNAQMQGSAYQESYVFRPYQPMADSPGLVDLSTVPTMRYAPANAAWMSTTQPSRLNPSAAEFKVSSTMNNLGASARPQALPTAGSAPAYPPGVPIPQQPQLTPSNGHRRFLAPDHHLQQSHSNGGTVRADTAPSNSNTPYLSPLGRPVTQQPQLTPSDSHRRFLASVHDWQQWRSYGETARAGAAPSNSDGPYSAPAYPPGLPATQQPQLTPSNGHQGFLAPDHHLQQSRSNGGTVRAGTAPSNADGLYSAPAYPASLPVTQQPQLTPSNGHRGFLAPDHSWQQSHSIGETIRTSAAPSNSDRSYSSPMHRQGSYDLNPLNSNTPTRLAHGTVDPQQPRSAPTNSLQGSFALNRWLGQSDEDYGQAVEAPTSPPALTHNNSHASQAWSMASLSPPVLGFVHSLDTDSPRSSPREWSRNAFEYSLDLSSHCGSEQDPSTNFWAGSYHTRRWTEHTAGRVTAPEANNTNDTSHSPHKRGTDIGPAAYSPTLAGQLESRYSIDAYPRSPELNNDNRRTGQNASKPLNKVLTGPFKNHYIRRYRPLFLKTAPPGADIYDFSNYLDSLESSYDESIGSLRQGFSIGTPSTGTAARP